MNGEEIGVEKGGKGAQAGEICLGCEGVDQGGRTNLSPDNSQLVLYLFPL
jgi:hypothetical protein